MKGVIFTAFLELVEQKWGLQMVDSIITDSVDPQDGAYNSVNYYPHDQMVNLVMELSQKTGINPHELMVVYGQYLFHDLAGNSPALIEGITSAFELLSNIELLIHTEVRKLYPEANPPRFEHEFIGQNQMGLTYFSHRSMASVAEGLILGCAEFYNENIAVEITGQNSDATKVEFLLTKNA